jgi:hypothetical protein
MNELRTVADKLSNILAPTLRKLHNLNVGSLGTRCEVLRIAVGTKDDWGQSEDDLKDFVLTDVIIKHPWASTVQVFSTLNEATQEPDASAIDISDLLPLSVYIPFAQDRDESAVNLMKGDLLVEVLYNEFGCSMPMVLQVTRTFGRFSVGFLCGKYYECCLYRGKLEDNIQNAVNLYCNSIAKKSE